MPSPTRKTTFSHRRCAILRSIRDRSSCLSKSGWTAAGSIPAKGYRIAPETTELFKRAMDRARSQGRRVIDGSDIFYVLSNDERSILNDVLQNLGVPSDEVAQTARTRIRKREKEEERSRQKYELPSFLRHFGVSMNKLARAGQDPADHRPRKRDPADDRDPFAPRAFEFADARW